MRVGVLGKRRYVFGLKWAEAHERKPASVVREALDAGSKGIFTSLRNEDDDRAVVGYGDLQALQDTGKGALYSYAAALAASGTDGIYVAPVDDGRLWYVVIAHGLPVPETDVTLELAEGLTAVQSMRATFGLPVLVAEGGELGIEPDDWFDPLGLVEHVKLAPLRRSGGAGNAIGAVVLIAVLGCVAFGAWWLFLRKSEVDVDAAADAQALAEAQRASYLASVRAAVAAHPLDTRWVVDAYADATRAYPGGIGGWRLDGVTCSPGTCIANYSAVEDRPRALAPMQERFGAANVVMLEDQKSLMVSRTVPTGSVAVEWSDNQVLAPRHWPRPASDVLGRLGLYFAKIEADGQVGVEDLGATMMPPPEARPLLREKVAIKQAEALDPIRLKGLVVYFGEEGFAPANLAFSTGTGGVSPAWRMEFVRLGGAP